MHVVVPNSHAIYSWFVLLLMRRNSFPIWTIFHGSCLRSNDRDRSHSNYKWEASCQGNIRGHIRLYWHWNLGWSLGLFSRKKKTPHDPSWEVGVMSKKAFFSAWFLICATSANTCWSDYSKSLGPFLINYNVLAF